MSEYILSLAADSPIEHYAIDTEAEEIVRCEDCKYMSRDSDVFKWCYRLSPEFACEPNGFCAWGKRREP